METRTQRYELYKAVKYQVQEYFGDHGWTLSEMWQVVNGAAGESQMYFWKGECLKDYREEVLGWID